MGNNYSYILRYLQDKKRADLLEVVKEDRQKQLKFYFDLWDLLVFSLVNQENNNKTNLNFDLKLLKKFKKNLDKMINNQKLVKISDEEDRAEILSTLDERLENVMERFSDDVYQAVFPDGYYCLLETLFI